MKKEIEELRETIRVLQVQITINSSDEKYIVGHGGHPLDMGIVLDQERLDGLKKKLNDLDPPKKITEKSKKQSK
jgi:cell division protein FtsL